jgi:hypothetical protein
MFVPISLSGQSVLECNVINIDDLTNQNKCGTTHMTLTRNVVQFCPICRSYLLVLRQHVPTGLSVDSGSRSNASVTQLPLVSAL